MLIGHLQPTSKPAQQLMELLWSEEEGEASPGQIFAFTSRLLALGYVDRNTDTLTVKLTERGRGVARTLSESTEGQLYRKCHEQKEGEKK